MNLETHLKEGERVLANIWKLTARGAMTKQCSSSRIRSSN